MLYIDINSHRETSQHRLKQRVYIEMHFYHRAKTMLKNAEEVTRCSLVCVNLSANVRECSSESGSYTGTFWGTRVLPFIQMNTHINATVPSICLLSTI